MDIRSINMEVCRQLLGHQTVHLQIINDEEEPVFLVIPNRGAYGYFLKRKEIIFDLEKLKEIPLVTKRIVDPEIVNSENEIKIMPYLRLIGEREKKARKFMNDDQVVWVDHKFLKNLDLSCCRFYQKKGLIRDMIVAVEDEIVVMCLLPMRILDDENDVGR